MPLKNSKWLLISFLAAAFVLAGLRAITLAEWPMTTYQEALAVAALARPSRIRSPIVVMDTYRAFFFL